MTKKDLIIKLLREKSLSLARIADIAETSTIYVSMIGKNEGIKDPTPSLEYPNPNDMLDIHIPKFTRMIAKGDAFAFLICGDPGVGKSYMVEKTLNEFPSLQWDSYGGDISPIGLYKKLFENREGVVVFDDIDAVFDNKIAANILKTALNSKDVRKISYLKRNHELFESHGMSDDQMFSRYIREQKYPNSFVYDGGCIFISNNTKEDINSAVRDRSIAEIEIRFTLLEMISRIQQIIHSLNPSNGSLDINEKYEVLQYLYENAQAQGKNISLRGFIKALTYRVHDASTWKDLSKWYI